MNNFICIPCIFLAGFSCTSAVLIDDFFNRGCHIIYCDRKGINYLDENSSLMVKGTEIPGAKRTLGEGWYFHGVKGSNSGIYCLKGKGSNLLELTYQLAMNKYLDFEDISQFEFSFPFGDSYSFSSYQVQIILTSSNGAERVTGNVQFSDDSYQVIKIEEYTDTKNFKADQINRIIIIFKYIGSPNSKNSKPDGSKIFGIEKIGAYPNIYPTKMGRK